MWKSCFFLILERELKSMRDKRKKKIENQKDCLVTDRTAAITSNVKFHQSASFRAKNGQDVALPSSLFTSCRRTWHISLQIIIIITTYKVTKMPNQFLNVIWSHLGVCTKKGNLTNKRNTEKGRMKNDIWKRKENF